MSWTRPFRAMMIVGFIASAELLHFEDCRGGTLPRGCRVAMTHEGGAPQWQVVRDESAPTRPNVLARIYEDRTAGRFPLAIWNDESHRDGIFGVAFKTVSAIDQAAGLVWRYRDPNNYYIARANALENNVVLYKVEHGVRLSIAPKGMSSRAYGVKHDTPKGRWNTLRVAFQGKLFRVFLNNELMFETEDDTFAAPGKAGLLTKADSVTYFDHFSVSGNE